MCITSLGDNHFSLLSWSSIELSKSTDPFYMPCSFKKQQPLLLKRLLCGLDVLLSLLKGWANKMQCPSIRRFLCVLNVLVWSPSCGRQLKVHAEFTEWSRRTSSPWTGSQMLAPVITGGLLWHEHRSTTSGLPLLWTPGVTETHTCYFTIICWFLGMISS